MGSVISLQTPILFSEEGARVAVYDVRPLAAKKVDLEIGSAALPLEIDVTSAHNIADRFEDLI